MCRSKLSEDIEEDVIPIPESVYIRRLHELAKETPIPKLLRPTERKIIEFVPEKMRQKYPRMVKTYMVDVHEDFDMIMRSYCLQKILRPLKDDFVPQRIPFVFKRLGKSKKYKQFLENRRKLRSSLLITYPFIRCILAFSQTDFPQVLNDYGQYAQDSGGRINWLTLMEFENIVQKDLEVNAAFLKDEWYPKIIKIIAKHYKRRTIPLTMWRKALACAKYLINRQLTEVKIRTFEHIFDVLRDQVRSPHFKFQTICSNFKIELYPSFNDIVKAYRNVIQNVADIGTKLPGLEEQIDRNAFPTGEEYLKVAVGDVYMADVLERLNGTLESAYAPILEYVEVFQEEFHALYSMNTKQDLAEFLKEPREFEVYLGRIEQFQRFITDLKKMVQNEFFNIATINQTKAIVGLRTIAQDFIHDITSNIVRKHQEDCLDIRQRFDSIKSHAFEIPKTTEMLLANGEYMLNVKNKQMQELQERIQANLKVTYFSWVNCLFDDAFSFSDWGNAR